MLRLVLLCMCVAAPTWAQESSSSNKQNSAAQGNTRLFNLGGLASAFNQVTGGNRPNQFGGNSHNHNQFGGNRPNQFGNNPFGGRPVTGGFNNGFQQGGFNNGFGQQGGFNNGFGQQGGFGQVGGGFGGGFGQVSPVVPQTQSCRRWCRTPQQQAYCCESGNAPIQATGVKRGQCPPVRPQCPPTRGFAPPAQCSSDGGCGGLDKCCFDTCLQHHTCKPPQGFGK